MAGACRREDVSMFIPGQRTNPLSREGWRRGRAYCVYRSSDQYLTNGVEVTFFGRKTRANPMLARLLRQIECPIHGVRIIRLPGHRFRGELSEEVKPVRDRREHGGRLPAIGWLA